MTFIFIFTLAMVITAMLKFIAIIAGSGMTLPRIIPRTEIDPSNYYVWYPSVMYQIYFWAEYIGVIV